MMNVAHLHPMLVHFPIALVLVALLADTVSLFCKQCDFSKCSFWLVILGTLGAVVSLASGFLFTKEITAGPAVAVKDLHVMLALITTLLLVIVSAIKIYSRDKVENKFMNTISYMLLLAASACVALTGMQGGTIVYDIWLF